MKVGQCLQLRSVGKGGDSRVGWGGRREEEEEEEKEEEKGVGWPWQDDE